MIFSDIMNFKKNEFTEKGRKKNKLERKKDKRNRKEKEKETKKEKQKCKTEQKEKMVQANLGMRCEFATILGEQRFNVLNIFKNGLYCKILNIF